MQLITSGLRDQMISGYTDYLNSLKQQLHTYNKRKRVLLLIVLLVLPLGILWVFLIMKADQNLKNTLSKNGKSKRRFFSKKNQN
jgi:hypothetical protein